MKILLIGGTGLAGGYILPSLIIIFQPYYPEEQVIDPGMEKLLMKHGQL